MMLSVAEAAKRANVTEMTVRRRIKDGQLPTVEHNKRIRISTQDVDRVLLGKLAPPPHACRVIALANQKGGVGKTTTAANLATALSQDGTRVLAVDCDPQGNLTQALGIDPDRMDTTLYNVLVERLPLDQALLSPIHAVPSLSLVGANLDLAMVDTQLSGAVARDMRLKRALEPYLDRFDYVILDCPPALGLLTLNALSAATEVIVPVDIGVFSLRGVAKLRDTIEDVRAENTALTRVAALCSRVKNTNLAQEVRAELARGFGPDLFETSINETIKVGEAQANRQPITLFRPGSPAAKDYIRLAEEVRKYGS